jgi:hypothetical protein
MVQIVRDLAPECELVLAQVFDMDMCTTAESVATGVYWCASSGAELILMALGLLRDDMRLRRACEDVALSGIDLIASAPPRGGPVFPAAISMVIAVCGDIRCGRGEVSQLDGDPADFGAANAFGVRRGASCAAASVTGVIAAWRGRGNKGNARNYLSGIARYRGRERRSG